MNYDTVEPRKRMWALAEILWQDASGADRKSAATIEDTSVSGVCLRMKTPIEVGSGLTVKWHRDEFSGVARNRRQEGREFLIGIQKTGHAPAMHAARPKPEGSGVNPTPPDKHAVSLQRVTGKSRLAPGAQIGPDERISRRVKASESAAGANTLSVPEERNMQPTPLFRKFWRNEPRPEEMREAPTAEDTMNNARVRPAEQTYVERQSELLSCEDIYRSAGILGSRSKYDIGKIIDMLHSKHIRELPKEVRRASILMALDAAATPVDEILNDATRRQHALNTYESSQQKQFEQFEADKTRENAQIKLEMERVIAHYEDRMRRNLEQVTRERETLHNWRALKEQESQRISEAVTLCGKQPLIETPLEPQTALVKAAAATGSEPVPYAPSPSGPMN
jgi:hypothetical protein